MNRSSMLAFFAIIIVAGCDTNVPEETSPLLAEVGSIPISAGFDKQSGAELERFSDLVGRARIVALGESRHDTSEQFLVRAALSRYLIENLGFRVIILEESFSHALALDAWVATGDGDLRSVLNGLAGWYLWDTEEMVSFLDWVRRFNETVPANDRVRIFGMDITAPAAGIRHAADMAERMDPTSGWASREYGLALHAGDYWPQILERYAGLDATAKETARRNLTDLANFLETESRKPEAGTEVQLVAVEAYAGKRAHDMFSSDGIANIGAVREAGMADLVDWIISHNGVTASTIIWTHNLHAATAQFRMPKMVEGPLTPMGVFLEQSYGAYYFAIGGAFGTGKYEEGIPPGGRHFELPGPETIDGAIAQLGHSAVLLDLANLDKSSAAAQWLSEERTWRMQDSAATLSAMEAFDAIYYVERVTRAQPTPFALQKFRVSSD